VYGKQRTLYLDLIYAEQGGRSGSPEQLTEAVLVVFLKETALECPQPVGVVHLNTRKWSHWKTGQVSWALPHICQ